MVRAQLSQPAASFRASSAPFEPKELIEATKRWTSGSDCNLERGCCRTPRSLWKVVRGTLGRFAVARVSVDAVSSLGVAAANPVGAV